MKEKFADYEGSKFLDCEGEFEFEITDYELTDGKAAPVAKFDCKSDEGTTTIRHSLSPKARWSYNNLIRACLKLTKEQAKTFELDYETIGKDLVGKKFIGVVEAEVYSKEVKVPLDDGTFETTMEDRTAYRITEYKELA